jgi:hypothetical protein
MGQFFSDGGALRSRRRHRAELLLAMLASHAVDSEVPQVPKP